MPRPPPAILNYAPEIFWMPHPTLLNSTARYFLNLPPLFQILCDDFSNAPALFCRISPLPNLNVAVANFKFSPHEIAKSWSMTALSSHSQKLAHVLWWLMGLPLMAFERACVMTKFITYTSYTVSDKISGILQATTWLMYISHPLACKLASSIWAILTKRFLMQVEFLALNALGSMPSTTQSSWSYKTC